MCKLKNILQLLVNDANTQSFIKHLRKQLAIFSTFLLVNMGIIKVENIRVYAYHGCLVEEGKIGSDYRVDVKVKADLSKSTKSDELVDTVDYVHLNLIVKEEMAIRAKLLEHVADRIIGRTLEEIPMVNWAKVSVSKINPPIGGNVEKVTISLIRKRKD